MIVALVLILFADIASACYPTLERKCSFLDGSGKFQQTVSGLFSEYFDGQDRHKELEGSIATGTSYLLANDTCVFNDVKISGVINIHSYSKIRELLL